MTLDLLCGKCVFRRISDCLNIGLKFPNVIYDVSIFIGILLYFVICIAAKLIGKVFFSLAMILFLQRSP